MADTTSKQTLSLPFGGEFFPTEEKRFAETILIVPFYDSTKSMLKRHVEYFNHLGYDAAVFTLKTFDLTSPKFSLFSSKQTIGIKHIWADQIEAMLNHIPGNKIVFAFCNPSASAIEAIARRNAADISGLVCDSGPSGNLLFSSYNYFTHFDRIGFLPSRALAALGMTLGWSPQFYSIHHDDLKKLPKGFRLLSIRGWKDNIINAHDIDKIFEPHAQLDWQRLSLPQAGHLNGLKDFPDEYEGPVADFLKSISKAC